MNGGSTRLWSGVQCSVMRRCLKDLGEFPNCLTTGSKTARCTAPWVGFSVLVSKGSHPEEASADEGSVLTAPSIIPFQPSAHRCVSIKNHKSLAPKLRPL